MHTHTRFGGIPSAPQNAAAFIGREHSGRKAYGNVHRIAAMWIVGVGEGSASLCCGRPPQYRVLLRGWRKEPFP